MNKEKIGAILRKTRKAHGKSLIDMEPISGYGKTTLSNMENGFPSVSDDKYIHYAKTLNIAEKLFGIVSKEEEKERFLEKRMFEIEPIVFASPSIALNQINNIENMILEHSSLLPVMHYIKGRCFFAQDKWKEAQESILESVELLQDVQKWKYSKSSRYVTTL
ncbi:hypothetical protein SAMN05444392_11077 [Seinonella peptonophila]|uniref:HTH cro/C1-type domain-containing protein n=1 Tax=Seinonella peptonophila TaxID=112248 RepID=A0A1M4ZRQ6_9BACL|nr:helix-turn-helix transcriptional regulator [Seinonella peptonophila]SHF20688.1 hypothetical protein SAMN05444392_11077 [Seinonella peptonophila]